MRKIKLLFALTAMVSACTITAQVSINTDGTTPDASAMFEVKSSDKGFLPPRMTATEIGNIASPANGLFVFNTTDNKAYIFVSADNEWKELNYGTGTITPTPATWSCGDALVDTRDSKSYTTIQIGTQCWMAENLNIGTRIDGSGNQTDNGTIEKYCYDDNTSNCDTYGGLYQWNEMMQYITTEGTQGICPTGWHLPTDAEWCTLEQEVDPTITCSSTGWRGVDGGGKLKEAGTTHWTSPNTGATNSSGFTGLPGGYRNTSASFLYLTDYAGFWSSSENGANAWHRDPHYNSAQVYRGNDGQAYGFSVRCIRD